MFQFKSSDNIQQRKKWRFKMNFADKFLNWYQKNYTEITWFLIGYLAVQILNSLSRFDYLGALWCVALLAANYIIWKRSR